MKPPPWIRSPSFVKRLLERLGVRASPAPAPAINDSVRSDGGAPTDEQRVPDAAMDLIKKNAVAHTKDEPGS